MTRGPLKTYGCKKETCTGSDYLRAGANIGRGLMKKKKTLRIGQNMGRLQKNEKEKRKIKRNPKISGLK
jgi:hypothetical protein